MALGQTAAVAPWPRVALRVEARLLVAALLRRLEGALLAVSLLRAGSLSQVDKRAEAARRSAVERRVRAVIRQGQAVQMAPVALGQAAEATAGQAARLARAVLRLESASSGRPKEPKLPSSASRSLQPRMS